ARGLPVDLCGQHTAPGFSPGSPSRLPCLEIQGMRRSAILWILVAAFCSLGAQHQTANFFVHAPNAQIAQQIGQYAEQYRREKAILWLGQEMPRWPQPCPLYVNVTMEPPSGATSFHFGPGG